MFSTNNNMKTLEELVAEIKHYCEFQKRFVALEFVSKLIMLLAALILGVIMFIVGAVVIILLALCAASLVGDITGSQTLGYAVVTLLFVLVAVAVYAKRKVWITRPVTNFLCNLFLKKN